MLTAHHVAAAVDVVVIVIAAAIYLVSFAECFILLFFFLERLSQETHIKMVSLCRVDFSWIMVLSSVFDATIMNLWKLKHQREEEKNGEHLNRSYGFLTV